MSEPRLSVPEPGRRSARRRVERFLTSPRRAMFRMAESMSQQGVRNASRALSEDEDARRTLDGQLRRLTS